MKERARKIAEVVLSLPDNRKECAADHRLMDATDIIYNAMQFELLAEFNQEIVNEAVAKAKKEKNLELADMMKVLDNKQHVIDKQVEDKKLIRVAIMNDPTIDGAHVMSVIERIYSTRDQRA